MGAPKRAFFDKSWMDESKDNVDNARKLHKFQHLKVTKSEDLPQLLTTKEAADLLNCHPKTVESYRKEKSLRFIKIRCRWFTTPEFIADFIETESNKK